ncbi:MAG: hypothetical protein ACI4W2_00960 [Eubacterium sp.]
MNFSKYSSQYDAFKRSEKNPSFPVPNVFNPAACGGALMDLGCYGIEFMVGLFGKPDEVRASSVRLYNGIDGAGTMLASYPGMLAQVSYSKIYNDPTPSRILGEEGTLTIPHLRDPQDLALVLRSGRTEVLHYSEERFDTRDGGKPINTMVYELADFARMLTEGNFTMYQKYKDITLTAAAVWEEAARDGC